jgi:hypothetical protein
MGNMVIMTRDIMHKGMSSRGGWSNLQWNAIGITKFSPKGWKRALIGQEFPEEGIKRFLELKDDHLVGKSKMRGKMTQYIPVTGTLTWEEQYLHPNWQRRRLQILKRDRYTCRICGDVETTLHVHHIRYDKNKWIWDVHEIYLVTLCDPCHEAEHEKIVR